MKKYFNILYLIVTVFMLVACEYTTTVTITSKLPKSFETREVFDIDFTEYFVVNDPNNPDAKLSKEHIDITEINYKTPGIYKITVYYQQVLRTYKVIFEGIDYTKQTDEKVILDIVKNIEVIDNKNLSITVKFSLVENADIYLIHLIKNGETISYTTSFNEYKISIEEGNYSLKIQAKNSKNQKYLNSDWSELINFSIELKEKLNYTQYTSFETQLQNKIASLGDKFYGVGLPSVGNVKILVIPVQFSDYSLTKSGYTVDDIEKAFFGTKTETGWESLKTYYEKSSYGKLTINGTVLEPFTASQKSSYYVNEYNKYGDGEQLILEEVMRYYDSKIDFSEYDYNSDGYIDGIYLIYSKPQDYDYDTIWWAWQYYYSYYDDTTKYDGKKPNYYIWSSVQFFAEFVDKGMGYDKFGNEALPDIKLNAHTIIHETGHLMGIDDYYDYETSKGPSGGLGGADMMDSGVGDHNPFTKMMFGWVNPYIVYGDATLTLKSFEDSGECILIPKNINNGYFSEYLLIDFYMPIGLNEIDKEYLFTTSGVRIFQVDAAFNYDYKDEFSFFKYNNTNTSHKLIRYIEADGKFDIEKSTDYNTYYAENNDLFKSGNIFNPIYWNNLKWYDGKNMNFTITVDEIKSNTVTITIDYNN